MWSAIRPSTARQRVVAQSGIKEIRFCTGKVCKKQGSPQVLKFVQDLQLTEVEAVSSGCLSQCGNGPNVLVDGRVVFHVATAADAIELLQEAGIDIDASIMSTTALRLAGNELAKAKQYASAVEKYTEALAIGCRKTSHLLYSNRSAMYMHLKSYDLALEDAKKAVELAPKGYHMAYVRLIDAYYALSRFQNAEEALAEAVKKDAGFKTISEYKAIVAALAQAKAKKR